MRTSERGVTFTEVFVGMCILVILAIAIVAILKPRSGKEHIILKAPTYTNGDHPLVEFEVRSGNGGPFKMNVPVECVDVLRRLDGEKYASLMCREVNSEGNACQSATILVPEGDIALWRAEVDRWKNLRKPPHVVPKPQSGS